MAMRISGMATGLDTDTLIRDLMRAERGPVNKLSRNKQLLEWRQAGYRDMNSLLLNLRNMAFDMRLGSSFKSFATSSSNDNVVSVSGTAASATTYVIDKITNLAKPSRLVTGDGQNVSRKTSVITGGKIASRIDTDNNNTFKMSFDGGAMVDITLDSGKVYDGVTPGRLHSDLVNDIQAKVDAAIGVGNVKVSLTKNNSIQFTSNESPASGSPKSIVLGQGDSNDLLKASFNINTDIITKQISSTAKSIDMADTIYNNILQNRFNNGSLTWIVNGSDSTILGSDNDNFSSAVEYNSTNIKNYNVTTFDGSSSKKYTVVTGKLQSELSDNEVLVEDDGSGKARFIFKEPLTSGTQISVDRHDFEITISSYKQDGTQNTSVINIDAYSETIDSLTSRINTNSSYGVSMFYDSGTDKMMFNAKQTGDNNVSGQDIEVSGSFLTQTLGLTEYTEGSDAVLSINGLNTTRKSNSFAINGVSFNLKNTSDTAITITSSAESEKTFDMIKNFVSAYNETIDKINGKITEERFRKYMPLIKEEKDSMSEKDIELWETRAKSGLLYGDRMLQSTLSKMRSSFNAKVEGVSDTSFDSLASIGISPSTSYRDRGKLVINETKLKQALSENPDRVIEMFTKTSSSTDITQKYRESGFAVRMYEDISTGMKQITSMAGSLGNANNVMSTEIRVLERKIEDIEIKLIYKENDYYKRFAALEKQISNMNTQSSWLSQQLGSR